MKRLRYAPLLALLALGIACEGPTGPEGPMGPTGPQGAQGIQGEAGEDFSYFVGTAFVGIDRRAEIRLPSNAGTATNPPLLTCYIGDGAGSWLVVGTDVSTGGATCGLVRTGSYWTAVVIGAVPGWIFRVVAVW